MEAILLYPAIGAIAGFMAGLFGIGGGVVIVPLLAFAFGLQQISESVILHLAIGTSLATIALTSLSSAWAHYQRGNVRRDCLLLLLPGLIAGAVLGVFIGDALSGGAMSLLLGIFFLLLAIKLVFNLQPGGRRPLPGRLGMMSAGGIIGALSALFGIGGGSLSVPFLEWRSVPMKQAVGTSSAAGIPIAVIGALTAMLVGSGTQALPQWSTGYVYWPAFLGIVILSVPFARLGARVASGLSNRMLKRIFAGLIVLVAFKFLLG
ncbi:sulfite exporter TauE/SafE family protein [Kushneria phosphatilytica]|uniref:Probable membrane transporter protein n=1 Tax=Kushneria phosphatilytica TaxID=657387 RepID=A0A5C1A214_9GAMM|nr:sulfite exporter TauE/SafE family protein [Kushneria phosphatilytica]QEL11753.1 sulfite exporter TauE/SafE family protein [Kushneria phosphatilytica]